MDFTDQFLFDDSSLGLTGVDTLSPDYAGDSALLGSTLQLDTGELGITDYSVGDLGDPTLGASSLDDWSLGGASDPAPSAWDDLGFSDNGSGSAAPSDGARPSPSLQAASLIGGFEKFGSSIAALLLNSNNGSHVAVAPGGSLRAANPNNSGVAQYGITGSHAVLIAVVAGILIVVVLAGGSRA